MEVESLAELVKRQAIIIQEQAALIKELQGEIVMLRDQIAHLKKNSSNSSKPTSSDIVKPAKVAGQQGKQEKRNKGGQPGHQKHERQPFSAEQVDTQIDITLEHCPHCGSTLQASGKAPEIHQQIALVEKPFIVTEYRCHQYWCATCQSYHSAPLPAEAQTGLFAPNLMALVAYLKGHCHVSYSAIQDFLSEVLCICICRGFLAKQIEKVSRSMKAVYEDLVKRLPQAAHIHIDETGWKENGKRRWIWAFKTNRYAVFRIKATRGEVVLEDTLGKSFAGTISCDFYSAYRMFKRLSSCALQFCWAHIIREIRFLCESADEAVARYGRELEQSIQAMFTTIHQKCQMADAVWVAQMQEHKAIILERARGAVPVYHDAELIAKRFERWSGEYFGFIERGIPSTNNPGEQTIRQVVLDRKVTQGSRGERGNNWHERFWSIATTCELQKRSVMSFLKDCISAYLRKQVFPVLLSEQV
jgi:transposase